MASGGLDPVSRGDGDWLLRLHLIDPNTHIEAEVSDGLLRLAVAPGAEGARPPIPDAPTLEELLTNQVQSERPEPLPTMRFLSGEALSYRLEPEDYTLTLGEPPWLAEDPGGWGRLDYARSKLLDARQCGVTCAQSQALALYELGWRYLEMGWDREGRHYLEQLDALPGALSPLPVATARARAAIEAGRWEEARGHLSEAWVQGESIATVAEALAVVSLATGVPARGPMGRLLANATAEPQAQALAVELLQMDGQLSETIPIAEPILGALEGETLQRVALRLGDAYLVEGRIDEARRAWQSGPSPLSEFRGIYAELYRAGPEAWVTVVPLLNQRVRERDEVSVEALYLISQIDDSLGVEVDAIGDLAMFMEMFGERARRSDVPARLWRLYSRRAKRLAEDERWYALASLHESAWNPLLFREVDDPTVLWQVSRAYEALGLPRRAVEVLAEGFAVLVDREAHNPEMVFQLARLYEELDNQRDGLRTIRYLRERGIPPGQESRVALMAGRMMLASGERAPGILELRAARKDETLRDEVDLTLASLAASEGDCTRALPELSRLLLPEDEQATPPPAFARADDYLTLTRCAAEAQDYPRAARAARTASERALSEEEARYAGYLATLYGQPEAIPESLSLGEDIWSRLAQERQTAAQFDQQLGQRLPR